MVSARTISCISFFAIPYTFVFYCNFVVYHVGPNGWTQVWRGDTTEMYYNYYPLEAPLSTPVVVEGGAEEVKNGA
jgi:hypothetical protein